MKRFFVFTFFLIIISQIGFSQFHFGYSGHLGISDMREGSLSEKKTLPFIHKPGLSVGTGVLLSYRLANEKVGFEIRARFKVEYTHQVPNPEYVFPSDIEQETIQEINETNTYDERWLYLEVPIILVYSVNEKFRIRMGYEPNFVLRSSIFNNSDNVSNQVFSKREDYISKILLGVEIRFNHRFGIELMGSIGLSPADYASKTSIVPSCISLGGLYYF